MELSVNITTTIPATDDNNDKNKYVIYRAPFKTPLKTL